MTGTYTIFVDPQGTNTGSITLTLTDPPTPPGAVASFHRPVATPAPSAAPTPVPYPLEVSRAMTQFAPTDSPEWTPDSDTTAWQTGRTATPWASLLPLQAHGGETALAGQSLTVDGRPLSGVSLSVEDTPATAKTDNTGRFLLTALPSGHHVLVVDGSTAGTAGHTFGRYEIGVDIHAGYTNVLDYTIWMTASIIPASCISAGPTAHETVLTNPKLPGLEVRIPAGTVLTDDKGKPVTTLSLTPVPVDRPPFPLPANVVTPLYFTVQPATTYLSKGAQIIYPNSTHEPAGAASRSGTTTRTARAGTSTGKAPSARTAPRSSPTQTSGPGRSPAR